MPPGEWLAINFYTCRLLEEPNNPVNRKYIDGGKWTSVPRKWCTYIILKSLICRYRQGIHKTKWRDTLKDDGTVTTKKVCIYNAPKWGIDTDVPALSGHLVQMTSSWRLPWQRWHCVHRRENFSSRTFRVEISFWYKSDSRTRQCLHTATPGVKRQSQMLITFTLPMHVENSHLS